MTEKPRKKECDRCHAKGQLHHIRTGEGQSFWYVCWACIEVLVVRAMNEEFEEAAS